MPQETKEVQRLTQEAYDALVKKVPPIAVSNDTQPQQMGFQLGCQFMLKLLREGFTLGDVR